SSTPRSFAVMRYSAMPPTFLTNANPSTEAAGPPDSAARAGASARASDARSRVRRFMAKKFGASVELARALEGVAIFERCGHGGGGRMRFRVQEHGAAAGGLRRERGREQREGVVLRQRVERRERRLPPLEVGVVGERGVEEEIGFLADALRLRLERG